MTMEILRFAIGDDGVKSTIGAAVNLVEYGIKDGCHTTGFGA